MQFVRGKPIHEQVQYLYTLHTKIKSPQAFFQIYLEVFADFSNLNISKWAIFFRTI